jgi:hypothetical protein
MILGVFSRVLFGVLFWVGVFRLQSKPLIMAIICMIVGGIGYRFVGRRRAYQYAQENQTTAQKYTGLPLLESGAFLIAIASFRFGLPFLSSIEMGWLSTPVTSKLEFTIWGVVATVALALIVIGVIADLGALHPRTLIALGIPVDADTLLRVDRRRPIIFLRPFDSEAKRVAMAGKMGAHFERLRNPAGFFYARSTFWELCVEIFRRAIYGSHRSVFDQQVELGIVFSRIAPYIAIGRPTETFRDTDFYAAKKFVPDDQWKMEVLAWLSRCAAVILEVGASPGINWEVEQVLRLVLPTAVLLILPGRQEDYAIFLRNTSHLFPNPLPDVAPTNRLLTFDSAWRPLDLGEGFYLEDKLQPFLEMSGLAKSGAE